MRKSALLLFMCFGCDAVESEPPPVIPVPVPQLFLTEGTTRLTVETDGSWNRHRFEVRVFNHTLHPLDVIQSEVVVDSEGQTVRLGFADGLITGPSPMEVVPHPLSERFQFEVETDAPSDLQVRITSRFVANRVEPPVWANAVMTVDVAGVDAGPFPLQRGDAPSPGPDPVFPEREPQCGRLSGPPNLDVVGPPFLREAFRTGRTLRVVGEGFGPGLEIGVGAWAAPSVEIRSSTVAFAQLPLLSAGTHAVWVRDGAGGGEVLAAALDIPLSTAEPTVMWPEAVTRALRHGETLWGAAGNTVYSSRPAGFSRTYFLPSGTEVSDLAIDGQERLLISTTDGLYRGQDSRVEFVSQGRFFGLASWSPGVWVAGGIGALAVTVDDGENFTFYRLNEGLQALSFTDVRGPLLVGVDFQGALKLGDDVGRGPWRDFRPEGVELRGIRDFATLPSGCERFAFVTDAGLQWSAADDGPLELEVLDVQRVLRAGDRVFAAGFETVWSWELNEWAPVARLLDAGVVTALAASDDGNDVHVFQGRTETLIRMED